MNNSLEINQVLAQMRVMAAQAQSRTEAVEQPEAGGFGELFKQSIDQVNQAQQTAGAMKTAFESGQSDMDLAQVMIATQKSSLAFEAAVQVRNKLVEAYKEVMNMPI
jgi:flagellar hook-basal body complex protein FliE